MMNLKQEEDQSSPNINNSFSQLRDGGGGVALNLKTEGDHGLSGSADDVNGTSSPTATVTHLTVMPAPNSKPRELDPDEDTYTYRDFATIPAPSMGGAQLHPQSLQAQKLPAKLASMLSDPVLSSVIMWLPHGRSWRVLNRDMFAEHALPRYFGHKNYASFVRIVNAWGFRRITRGSDRDSYYHELFLRGRPDLHQRMKRLSTCHRKTPLNKEEKCPDFYELAKTSPLPEVSFQMGGGQAVGGNTGGGGIMPQTQLRPAVSGPAPALAHFSPPHNGVPGAGAGMASLGTLGGPMGNLNEQVLSMLTKDPRSMNAAAAVRQSMGTDNPAAQAAAMPRLAQLQRDNEDLRRRIMEMENQGGGASVQLGRNPMIPDQLANLSANLGGNSGLGGGGGNDMLSNELKRMQSMQRDFMMNPNTPNSMNNSLLSSLSGGAPTVNNPAPPVAPGAREFSFMTGFPRDEMLLRAMRFENQMGLRGGQQQQQQASSATSSSLERAFQHQQSGGSVSSAPLSVAPPPGCSNDADRTKAMMDWVKQQQGKM